MSRISFEEYGMLLADAASKRSSDPYKRVGAVIFDSDNRILSVGYNGTLAGFKEPPNFWDDRQKRSKFIIHAETNALSLIERGKAKTIFVTLCPCTECLKNIISHGITNIYYGDEYPKTDAIDVAKMYNVNLQKL